MTRQVLGFCIISIAIAAIVIPIAISTRSSRPSQDPSPTLEPTPTPTEGPRRWATLTPTPTINPLFPSTQTPIPTPTYTREQRMWNPPVMTPRPPGAQGPVLLGLKDNSGIRSTDACSSENLAKVATGAEFADIWDSVEKGEISPSQARALIMLRIQSRSVSFGRTLDLCARTGW